VRDAPRRLAIVSVAMYVRVTWVTIISQTFQVCEILLVLASTASKR